MIPSSIGIEDISLDGFQIVNSSLFVHYLGPTMVIYNSAISFSGSAIDALNKCECIQIMVSGVQKKIVVKPVASSESEALCWYNGNGKPKMRRIECSYFTRQLYESWGWNSEVRYRALGHLVKSGKDKKLMLLFDFNDAETWKGTKMVKDNE